jgi:two-component system CheB/CheR fusion protein
LLIYLQDDAQQRAISGFRFALKHNGILMLGPSESLGKLADGFTTIDKDWRAFRKNKRVSIGGRSQKRLAAPLPYLGQSKTYELLNAQTRRRANQSGISQILDFLIDGMLISSKHRIEQLIGNIENFFPGRKLTVGSHLVDHFDSAELATIYALHSQAAKQLGTTCTARNVPFGKADGDDSVQLKATALEVDGCDNPALVLQIFPDQLPAGKVDATDSIDQSPNKPLIDSLQEQLHSMRATLGESIQELEANNEEMQSANEEMIASNEEMQATNEELQSVNEELRTVNIEHQRKVQELQEITDDFNNLFNSTRVGLILLDENLLIRKFTSVTSKYFNLLEHDIGRPLSNFAPKLCVDDLFTHVREVIANGTKFSENVKDAEGHTIALEVMPYRSSNLVNGAIISLIDVSAARGIDDDLTSSGD